MNDKPDLDAYLERIGHAGPRDASLETLHALQRLHPQAIPFENLNPLLRWPVRLDLASLQDKLVHGRRGGYCFEQNLLFMQVLRALGFDARGLAARVLWGLDDDAVRPRSHMLLLVDLDGARWIADVGFGGQTLTAPLRLEAGLEQDTPHGRFVLRALGDGDWILQARVADEWKSLYRFDLQPQHAVDYEVASWYLTSHPSSHFLAGLIVARTAPDGRHALRDNALAWHPNDGATQRRVLGGVDALHGVLADVFGLALPRSAQVDAALAAVIRASD